MNTIVIGSLNTDLVAVGVKKFPKPGEHVYGRELRIGAGGKSRNIADMLAHLTPPGSVAMIGRTVKDPYGLWKAPLDALSKVKVNTDYVNVLEYEKTQKLPGIALIPVDENGNNQIFVLPGISDDFSTEDIDAATPLFEACSQNNGFLITTLECPLATVKHTIAKANEYGLKVIFDPGGIEDNAELTDILQAGIYLIKPNEHETKVLTGIQITNLATAQEAATKLHSFGIENVLITVGSQGAYLSTKETFIHIVVPAIALGTERDETGCGDQTIAALCATLQNGKPLQEAANLAILAGTLQFYRLGVQPVEKDELLSRHGSL
jgi:ribokinase